MKRTVVMIHPGALGDVLLAVPAMHRLRSRLPHHQLVLCAAEEVSRLLAEYRIVDEWISLQSADCAGLFAGSGRLTGRWRTWFVDCDLAIAWMNDCDGTLAATMKGGGVREAIVQSPFSNELRAIHQSDRFLEVLREAPAGSEDECSLEVTESLRRRGAAYREQAGVPADRPLVVFHPGSGSIHKCVGPEVLEPLIAAVESSGARPCVLQGPADRVPVERLLDTMLNRPIILKDLDLPTVADLLAQSQLFVGHDSGVTHLAALIGIPTVALFGPTDPDRWAPRGAQVTVIKGGPSFTMEERQVLSACLAHLHQEVLRERFQPGRLVPAQPIC